MAPNLTLLEGNAVEMLTEVPDQTVQLTVTSPPYWAVRKYGDDEWEIGQETLPQYVERLRLLAIEIRRVTTATGILALNIGDTYVSFNGRGPQGKTGVGGHDQRAGFVHNRIPIPEGCKREKDLALVPFEVARALRADGWYLRSVIPWVKTGGLGESVIDRPAVSHEYFLLLSKTRKTYYDRQAVRIDGKTQEFRMRRTGDWALDSLDCLIEQAEEWLTNLRTVRQNGGILSDVWGEPLALLVHPSGYRGHTAAYSRKLIRPLIAGFTRPGDTVLDPFLGSGTTAVEALSQDRDAVGVDLYPENLALTRERLAKERLAWKESAWQERAA